MRADVTLQKRGPASPIEHVHDRLSIDVADRARRRRIIQIRKHRATSDGAGVMRGPDLTRLLLLEDERGAGELLAGVGAEASLDDDTLPVGENVAFGAIERDEEAIRAESIVNGASVFEPLEQGR